MAMAEKATETHKCVFCSQNFPSKTELQSHFRLHANGEIDIKGRPKVRHKVTEDCQSASKSSSSAEDGNSSATGRNGVKGGTETGATTAAATTKSNAICDVCGEVFRTVSLAISHKFRKHPDSLLKHYCPHCGMMFPIKVNRDRHLLTHSSASPKQLCPCQPCGVTFYNQRAKKFHMDSAHKGAFRMVNPIRTPAPSMKIVINNAGEAHSVFYCHLCGCEYQVKYNLQKHLASKHSESEREARPKEIVQCNLCSAVFYTKRAYEAHSHHHREGDLFATNEQMRQLVVQRIDQDFDQRRVPTAVERYLSASAVSSNRSATWLRIQAARRSHTNHLSTSPSKEEKDEEKERKKQDGSSISDSLVMEQPPSKESKVLGEDGLMRPEFLCWGTDEGPPRKKRMMDDSEEDDGEMRSLGTVNPDSVLSTQASRRVTVEGVEDDEQTTKVEETEIQQTSKAKRMKQLQITKVEEVGEKKWRTTTAERQEQQQTATAEEDEQLEITKVGEAEEEEEQQTIEESEAIEEESEDARGLMTNSPRQKQKARRNEDHLGVNLEKKEAEKTEEMVTAESD